MRRIALLILAGAALAAPGPAQARATADVLVVGRERILAGPERVALVARTAKVAGRRCSVGARTPLSALAALGVPFTLTDFGACSRRPRDAGSLYVRSVAGERARGADGWVYKVGNRAGSTGAADPAGAFGTGALLRTGRRVLWFWCVKEAGGSCQRTLDATPSGAAVAGAALRVTVRGHDDAGRGIAVAGATVRLGDATATTGADGVASVTTPAAPGTVSLQAEKAGLVRSFPREVTVR